MYLPGGGSMSDGFEWEICEECGEEFIPWDGPVGDSWICPECEEGMMSGV